MLRGCPSFNQATVVAGEPVEVQVSVEENDPLLNTKSSVPMDGGAVLKTQYNILSVQA